MDCKVLIQAVLNHITFAMKQLRNTPVLLLLREVGWEKVTLNGTVQKYAFIFLRCRVFIFNMGYVGSDTFQQKNKLKIITYCWRVQNVALTEEQASLQQTENRLNMHERDRVKAEMANGSSFPGLSRLQHWKPNVSRNPSVLGKPGQLASPGAASCSHSVTSKDQETLSSVTQALRARSMKPI